MKTPTSSGVWAAPLSSVGPQLFYLAVHLLKDHPKPVLQPRPSVVGEVAGQSPRFLEEHAHVLQLR
jgi:hypothetical protein